MQSSSGSCRREREANNPAEETGVTPQLPLSVDGLQLTRVPTADDEHPAQNVGTEEEAREQIQARLPGADWKARIGAAGTPMEQQRVSPIVEVSMLLVSQSIHNTCAVLAGDAFLCFFLHIQQPLLLQLLLLTLTSLLPEFKHVSKVGFQKCLTCRPQTVGRQCYLMTVVHSMSLCVTTC